MRDRCRSQADEYENARSQFQSEKDSLDSALDDVERSVRSVSDSCDYSFTGSGSKPGRTRGAVSWCQLFQRYKGRLSPTMLMETCRKSHSEDECKKCLQ